ncbi:thiol-disulfide oxidoreductase ResA [Robertmurraya korlensis]|uniref:thiol-disulfide oxidoreductase ResA n=1 Tax=Robertmurraya korlensis TaxID=519977 RepID=UPI00203D07CC|nr:thiol-disulfide oxidoreductase ResA [Robertmurraya korlensis]MCM3599729.1 thiol-disulfide oxidoreductase ResA [Robertmurraya korlensis]
MKKQRLLIRTVILLLLGAAVAYTLYANFTKDEVQKVEVGKKAPDFVLTDLNGEKHQLSDYEGEGVLLNFWATWCKPCEKEMPFLNNQYQAYKDQGVHVIAVNVGESNVAVSDFSKRYDLQFPIVTDKDSQVMTAYGVDPLPITFLIDKQGNVVEIHKGQIVAEADVTEMMEKIKP